MENRIDNLFQHWVKWGAKAVVTHKQAIEQMEIELLIAESTSCCRDSSRLLWIVIDWMLKNIHQVEVQKLLIVTKEKGNLAVLGLISEICYQRLPIPIFWEIQEACKPSISTPEIFFHRVAKSPLAARLTMQNALDIFKNWNFYCNELRYLSSNYEITP